MLRVLCVVVRGDAEFDDDMAGVDDGDADLDSSSAGGLSTDIQIANIFYEVTCTHTHTEEERGEGRQ